MTTTTPPVDPAPATPGPAATTPITGRERTLALVVLLLATVMELVDVTIVNVALPTIERSLDASDATLQWVVAAYPLAFGIALITGARLGDRFGRRRLFVLGLVAFTLASAACGLAPTPETLVLFRAAQGLGAAMMVPQVITSIQVMYAPHERAAAMGMVSALAGLASVLGPILGGVLTDLAGWRAIFLVNVPVGVVAVVAALRLVPESRAARAPRLDLRGIAVLTVGLLAVLYPLTSGHELGWPVWTFALAAVGVVVLAAFVVGQRRQERAGGEPLVAVSLYRDRGFTGGTLVQSLLFVGLAGYFLATTIYLQAGLGWSVLETGLVNLPFAVTCTVTAAVGAVVLLPRIGRRVLAVGAVIMAAGAGLLAVVVAGATATTGWWAFVPGLVVVGAGFGLLVSSVLPLATGQVPTERAGAASGQINTSGQLANAVGAAALGTLFFTVAEAQVGATPLEHLRPAYLVVLAAVALVLLVVAAASRVIPADAHEHVDPTAH